MEPIIPTDEQIEAIRRADWADAEDRWDAMGDKYHKHMTSIYRQNFAAPGFQDFLREQMAEAFDAGVDAHNDAYTYGKTEIINPYRQEQ